MVIFTPPRNFGKIGAEKVAKNLEIGVLTKLIVTARIRGNVLLKILLFISKKNFEKKILKKKF